MRRHREGVVEPVLAVRKIGAEPNFLDLAALPRGPDVTDASSSVEDREALVAPCSSAGDLRAVPLTRRSHRLLHFVVQLVRRPSSDAQTGRSPRSRARPHENGQRDGIVEPLRKPAHSLPCQRTIRPLNQSRPRGGRVSGPVRPVFGPESLHVPRGRSRGVVQNVETLLNAMGIARLVPGRVAMREPLGAWIRQKTCARLTIVASGGAFCGLCQDLSRDTGPDALRSWLDACSERAIG